MQAAPGSQLVVLDRLERMLDTAVRGTKEMLPPCPIHLRAISLAGSVMALDW